MWSRLNRIQTLIIIIMVIFMSLLSRVNRIKCHQARLEMSQCPGVVARRHRMNVIIICLGGEPLLFPHFEVILNLCQFPVPAPAQRRPGTKYVKNLILVVVTVSATQLMMYISQ